MTSRQSRSRSVWSRPVRHAAEDASFRVGASASADAAHASGMDEFRPCLPLEHSLPLPPVETGVFGHGLPHDPAGTSCTFRAHDTRSWPDRALDLGRQPLDPPAVACATETQPVVQAVVALLPELERFGGKAKAAPAAWHR
jgi:hypothetical protein